MSLTAIIGRVACIDLAAQGLVRIPVNVTTSDPEIFVNVTAPASCDTYDAVAEGSFVKSETEVRLDARTVISGVCQFWYNGVHYPQFDTIRGIAKHNFYWTRPSQSTGLFPRFPPPGGDTQDYDTRDPNGGNFGLTAIVFEGGTYAFDAATVINKTQCNIQPELTALVSTTFHGMACKPEWWLSGLPENPLL